MKPTPYCFTCWKVEGYLEPYLLSEKGREFVRLKLAEAEVVVEEQSSNRGEL